MPSGILGVASCSGSTSWALKARKHTLEAGPLGQRAPPGRTCPHPPGKAMQTQPCPQAALSARTWDSRGRSLNPGDAQSHPVTLWATSRLLVVDAQGGPLGEMPLTVLRSLFSLSLDAGHSQEGVKRPQLGQGHRTGGRLPQGSRSIPSTGFSILNTGWGDRYF